MMHIDSTATRTLTLVLPESAWRALRTAEPDAIGWLYAQIQRRLENAAPERPFSLPSAATADSWWGQDDY
jgi:hypothetical protein